MNTVDLSGLLFRIMSEYFVYMFAVYLPLYWLYSRKRTKEERFGKKFWYGLIATIWVVFFGGVCGAVFVGFSYELWLYILWSTIITILFSLFLAIIGLYYIRRYHQ